MKLFIVESPTKARTIQRILGKDFVVKATLGHVKDLPTKDLGVDLETFEARYVYVRGKKKLMDQIRKLARSSEEVYIGTDPDREGEAIAFFVKEEVKKVNKNVKRAIFWEITPAAIRNSIKEAGDVNMSMVHSQFARRILDRLIGYGISPILWRHFRNNRLSAGRVQSPALRLIVEREEHIRNFRSKSYYYVKAIFEKDGREFYAIYDYRYENPSDAKRILERIRNGVFRVIRVSTKKEKINPPRPFITSSLQATASSQLGFSPEKTQRLAQELYERGYITYPRTDSYRMNAQKAREFLEYIKKNFGEEFVGKLRKFKDSPTSQSAHECIRVVDPNKGVELSGDGRRLYELVLRRTLASLSSPAVVRRVEVEIEVSSPELKRPVHLKARGVELEFEGWTRIYPHRFEGQSLPGLQKGDLLKPKKLLIEERKTSPPPRYTEGNLIKTLEKLGIGRPSTYATIVKSLKDKDYVRLEKNFLVPTNIAFDVIEFLKEHFPQVVDYNFTARLERLLDEIEKGRRNWKEVVREVYDSAVYTPLR